MWQNIRFTVADPYIYMASLVRIKVMKAGLKFVNGKTKIRIST
jgi:hypothetical protein